MAIFCSDDFTTGLAPNWVKSNYGNLIWNSGTKDAKTDDWFPGGFFLFNTGAAYSQNQYARVTLVRPHPDFPQFGLVIFKMREIIVSRTAPWTAQHNKWSQVRLDYGSGVDVSKRRILVWHCAQGSEIASPDYPMPSYPFTFEARVSTPAPGYVRMQGLINGVSWIDQTLATGDNHDGEVTMQLQNGIEVDDFEVGELQPDGEPFPPPGPQPPPIPPPIPHPDPTYPEFLPLGAWKVRVWKFNDKRFELSLEDLRGDLK